MLLFGAKVLRPGGLLMKPDIKV
ncbi:hypothetical protein AZE42_07916 [Rhizopogon vesiculosus]|uniref:Uncharacterized protein n=1 Tax=Rhizopogon vesiculosus TaxID=180088 RepID=A0A1J8QTJ8_9AGAM|nr:hypothetical protein AZE42_07916 [Rhizopogon vesiculosus]